MGQSQFETDQDRDQDRDRDIDIDMESERERERDLSGGLGSTVLVILALGIGRRLGGRLGRGFLRTELGVGVEILVVCHLVRTGQLHASRGVKVSILVIS